MNSSERRSSRSIKRKRFDDEIVDFTALPISRSSRQRTFSQSNTSVISPVASSAPESPGQSPPVALPVVSSSPVILPSPSVSSHPVPSLKLSPAHPVPTASPAVVPPVQSKFEKEPMRTVTPTTSAPKAFTTPVQTTVTSTTASIQHPQIKSEPPTPPIAVATPREPAPPPVYNNAALSLNMSSSIFGGDRRVKGSKKKNSKKGTSSQLATKDLGRWKPVDDLALIIGVQQTNDLKMVHRGTKFSCKFTMNELQNRWYALLYEESVSRIAVAAMRNLHPELVENIQSKALYSNQEEELLATIKSTESPTLENFAELLRKNAAIFYSARTPKTLQTHWQLMKQYSLLPDQVIKLPGKEGTILSFSDNEELLNDAELAEPKDEVLDAEMALVDRRNKREIRQLETELGRWNVLVDSMTGMGFPPEFDRQTLAVLRGRLVRYLMRSREISIGRSTKDSTVDVDLCLEGPAFKVSRKQGTIKLRSNADFFLTNEGKRPIYVDGMALLKGFKARLSHNCALEIAGLRFTFLVNFDLINAIQQESAKMNTPLT